MKHKSINYKLIVNGLILSTILYINNLSANTIISSKFQLNPYIGIGSGKQYLKFNNGYGDNLFQNELSTATVFVGIKFNDYFGIEAGYKTTNEGTKTVTIYQGEKYLGVHDFGLNFGENSKYFTESKLRGWNLGLIGEYPFNFGAARNYFSILGYVGIQNTNITLVSRMLTFGSLLTNNVDALNNDNKKTLLKLSSGLQYFTFDNVSFRAMGSFENTCRLRAQNHRHTFKAALKNSINYSLDLVFRYT